MSSETEKEKQFREVYGELTDEELEAYGGMIFRQIKEKEDKINKSDGPLEGPGPKEKESQRDPFQDVPIGRYPKKEKEDKDRQVGEDTKGSKSE